jgi:hypothetical protein
MEGANVEGMIEATWVGGPNDGAVIVLPDDGPIFLVSTSLPAHYLSNGGGPPEEFVPVIRARIEPVLTDQGWRLFYDRIEYPDSD